MFTKILAPPFARLRAQGITILAYLDSFFLNRSIGSPLKPNFGHRSQLSGIHRLDSQPGEILLKTIKEIAVLGADHRAQKSVLCPGKGAVP